MELLMEIVAILGLLGCLGVFMGVCFMDLLGEEE
jgi:hypothetical protein